MKRLLTLFASLLPALVLAAEGEFADLPAPTQVEAALRQHIDVQTATTGILLEHPEWVTGFSTAKIEGHSRKEHLPSMLEQVRGRSQRSEIRCVMNLEDAQALVAYLKEHEPNEEIAYWIAPIIEYGRLI